MMSNLKPYPSYKPSGVAWLGDVPAHWEVWRLKYSATLIMGQSPSSDDCSDIPIGPPFLQGCAEFGIRHPAPVQYCRAPSKISPLGAILMSVRAPVGRLNISNQEYGIGRGLCAIVPNNEILQAGLAQYQLEVLGHGLSMVATGSTYEAVSVGDVGNHLSILPPLAEQTAIVRYLDQTDERIRRYVSSRERLIELLEEYRQAVIHHAVTRGLDPDVRLKPSGVTGLGDMPAHWEAKRLKTIGRIRYGLGQPPRELADGLPLIRATNVDHGRIIDKNLLYIDPSDVPSGRDAILREKEIIVVRSGAYTGDSAIVPKAYDGAITGYDMVLSVTGAQPEFVAMALLCKYVRDDQLIVASTRSAQPHLNAEELGTAILLVPPLHEQAAIVAYLDKAIGDIDAAIDRARREIELLGEYRTRLIADVVTGKVDVREAAAELSAV